MPAERATSRQGGFTLVELLVYVLLLGIVLAAAFGLLISMTGAVSRTDTATQGTDQARLAVVQIDRMVRSGNVLYDPSAETNDPANEIFRGFALRVYTQANGVEKCMQWRITRSGELQTRSWSENWAVDGQITNFTTVATNIANRPSTAATPPPASLIPAFSLPTGYGNRLLKVTILANVNPKTNKDLRFDTTIAGRNTEYGYNPYICSSIPPY